ncbi:MAG: CHASE3 domain-containing protein [Candidatus Nitrosopolaris sp.]
MKKNISIDRVTGLAIAIPMIALLLVGYLSYVNITKFIQENAFADRTNLIIQKVERLASTVSNAETGQRGFIITGKPSYLDPYYTAVRDIRSQLQDLAMFMPNDKIKENLKPLTNLIDSKFDELSQTILLRQSHGINAALPIILSDRGKILMDRIRMTLDNIQNQENNLLTSEALRLQVNSRTIIDTIIIAILATAVITGVSIFAMNRRIHRHHLDTQSSLQAEVKKRTEELQNANNQLLLANTALVTTERAKEEFISMISHELKTPLVPLKGYAQMLLRPKFMGGAEVNERQKNAIDAMNRSIEKLQALVEDVMDVYKLDMGKLKFSMTDTDITKLINDSILDLRPLTLNKKIDLVTNIEVNGNVFCDPNRISQVLSNLIKNSIDFVPDNGNGKIIVRAQKEEDNDSSNNFNMILFTVEDNGIGINPEKADKLFQKFYQIDTGPTRKHAGTGLGLVICRGIIEAHGGKIWVDNACKTGATIKFTLPVRGHEDKGERDTGI